MRLLQAVRPWSQSCWPSTSALRTCKRRAIRIKIQWSRCILRLSRNDAALVMSCPVVSYRGLLSWCLNIEYGGKSGASRGQEDDDDNTDLLELHFFPPNTVHTEGLLRQESKPLAPSILPVNSRVKVALCDAHVHFHCAGSHKVCAAGLSRSWSVAFFLWILA